MLLTGLTLLTTFQSVRAEGESGDLSSGGEKFNAGEWQIEVRLVPDKSTIILGEPLYLTYEVQNHSDQNLWVLVGGDNQNRFGRPNSFTVQVARVDGQILPQLDAVSIGGGITVIRELPAHSAYKFRLLLQDWVTLEKTGGYTITAARLIQFSPVTGEWKRPDKTTDTKTHAQCKIQVTPPDSAIMGRIIVQLGEALFRDDDEKQREEAQHTIDWINDDRVIPYLVRAVESQNYERIFCGLEALVKFNDDRALAVMKTALHSSGSDFGDCCTTEEVAQSLAKGIRLLAAQSLAKSKHPDAIQFLLSQRKNPDAEIRLTVVHTLGNIKTPEAIALLQEMAKDENALVSGESQRYLKEFHPTDKSPAQIR